MASYQAIAAVGEAILSLLESARPPAPSEFDATQFVLYQASDFQNPTAEERISLYLYHIGISSTRRSFPPRRDADGHLYRPPLPLDLHYLLTPWAQDARKQQRLLGWSMRVLEDTPIIPTGLLNSFGPETAIFRPDETVELICEPLSLQEIVNIWDAFKPNLQISAAYVTRMILIDSRVEEIEGPLVQTRIFTMGKGLLS